MGVDIKVLTTEQYFGDVTKRLSAAKKGERIGATTMGFDPDEPRIADFMKALTAAAAKGARVILAVDSISFMIDSRSGLPNGPIMTHRDPLKTKGKYYAQKANYLKKFKEAGGQFKVINHPHGVIPNPIAGRSHIKTVVVGDDVYLGGCNLNGSDKMDLMMRIKDANTADYLYSLIERIIKTGRTQSAMHFRDQEMAIDKYTSLLIDSGARGQSTIMDNALQVIDNADEWLLMTCQYFPNATTARHLAAALARGVKIKLYFGRPGQHKVMALGHHLSIWQERSRNPRELFELQLKKDQPEIHAKIIATEKEVIIGSHNYVSAGVKLGTAEAAILRREPRFAANAAKIMESQIKSGE